MSTWLLFYNLLPKEFSEIFPVAYFVSTPFICPSVASECFIESRLFRHRKGGLQEA